VIQQKVGRKPQNKYHKPVWAELLHYIIKNNSTQAGPNFNSLLEMKTVTRSRAALFYCTLYITHHPLYRSYTQPHTVLRADHSCMHV